MFLEVVTVLAARRDLESAIRVGELLLGAREVEFVACSDLFLDAWRVLSEQDRFRSSFADAAIVAVARAREARFVATFDRGFDGFDGIQRVPA